MRIGPDQECPAHSARPRRCNAAPPLALALIVASAGAAEALTPADFAGLWLVTPARDGHRGIVLHVDGHDAALVETVVSRGVECSLIATTAMQFKAGASSATVSFKNFSVRCSGGRLVVHPQTCSYTLAKDSRDKLAVSCGKETASLERKR